LNKWLDWFGVRYVDFCGAHKSWPARILIGVVDAILLVGFWSYGITFILLGLISGVYCLVTHLPRKKWGWPPLWVIKGGYSGDQ
jgi:hypothetical protein